MREIYQNGPVALNFYATSDLYQYKSGIYSPSVDDETMEVELE